MIKAYDRRSEGVSQKVELISRVASGAVGRHLSLVLMQLGSLWDEVCAS